MKNRYKKFVYEDERGKTLEVNAKKGVTLNVSEGAEGELIIRAINVASTNVCSENYANPPIPEGYKYVEGEWYDGFVIERCSDGSQFVWIPVGSLDGDGTLDGEHFTQKFGRRNYGEDEFSENGFHEEFTYEFRMQVKSVEEYGGFYYSRHNISKSKITGKPQSVIGKKPWTNIKSDRAKKVASTFESSGTVTSHLIFGAEYDSVEAWLIKSGAKTFDEIARNSTELGNHLNTKNSPKTICKTGSNEKWCANKIYDFAGNVDELTQEEYEVGFSVTRGANCYDKGCDVPVNYRDFNDSEGKYDSTGFRIALCIK